MSHPLDDAETRCQWARQRFNLLQEEIAAFPKDAQAVRFRQEFDSNINVITVFVANEVQYPIEWALTVSEILYNCRVALDYVAWELRNRQQEIEGNADVEDRLTMFVIATTPEEFTNQHRSLKFLDPGHVTAIEALQPYAPQSLKEGRDAIRLHPVMQLHPEMSLNMNWEAIDLNTPLRHPLTILSALNIQDKHKILKRVVNQARVSKVGQYEGINCEILSPNVFVVTEIYKDAKWAEFNVRPTGPNPEVKVGDEVETGVSFGDLRVEGIDAIINCVVRVIETFRPVWPSHDAPPDSA